VYSLTNEIVNLYKSYVVLEKTMSIRESQGYVVDIIETYVYFLFSLNLTVLEGMDLGNLEILREVRIRTRILFN
jgi:hypothetical protein